MAGSQAEIDSAVAEAHAPQAAQGPSAPVAADSETPLPADGPIFSDRLQQILRIRVPLIVVLAQRKMPVGEILRISIGSIIEFEQAFDQELELLVNNRSVAFGQAVKAGENFGLRVARIADLKTRIDALGSEGEPA